MSDQAPSPEDLSTAALVIELLNGGRRDLPRHTHSLDRDEVRRIQRARLLAATATLVDSIGFSRLTVTALVKEAGVSTKTFYEHFEALDDAFLGLYTLLDVSLALFETAIGKATTVQEVLEAAATAYTQMLSSGGPVGRVLLVEALGASPAIRQRRVRSMHQFTEAITREISRLYSGPLDRDLVMAGVGAANELAYQHMLEHGYENFADLEATLRRLSGRAAAALEA